MGAFKAYDIRGVWNKDFDRDTVYRIGYFLPELLGTDHVVVGRDVRVSSPEIHDALIEGITDRGADVQDLGLATTPMVYFATVYLKADFHHYSRAKQKTIISNCCAAASPAHTKKDYRQASQR